MNNKKEKIQRLWADVNDYLIHFNLHLSGRHFGAAHKDRNHIKRDLKKIEKCARQLGLTSSEYIETIRHEN